MRTLVGTGVAGILAHAGGWDEVALVLVPLVLVAGLLLAANRRAKRLLVQRQAAVGAADTIAPAGPRPTDADGPTDRG